MTWPYYVLAACFSGLLALGCAGIIATTVDMVRDKRKLYSRTERISHGVFGGFISLLALAATVSLSYLFFTLCDYAHC